MLLKTPKTHPLSSPQVDIYYDQMLNGSSPTYNIGGYLTFTGALNVDVFEKALKLVVKSYDALRIMLVESGGDVPMQRIAEEVPTRLTFLDFSSHPSPSNEALGWIKQNINVPFDLFAQPLFRWSLLKLGEDHFYWFICVHHLIADGWSIDRIFQTFAGIYSSLESNEDPQIDAPSYLDFVAADQQYLSSSQFTKDRTFWLEQYSQLPEPMLSQRHKAQCADQMTASGDCSWKLSPLLDDMVNAVAAEHHSTRFQVLLGLYAAFFLRMEQRDEVTIGLSVLNRKNAEQRRTAGLFSNVMPLTLRFHKDETFLDLLREITPRIRQGYRHQRFPIGELNKGLNLFANQRSQLYELSISYEHGGGALLFGSTTATAVRCTNDHEGTPLRMSIRDDLERKEATIYFIFGQAYFSEAEIEELRNRFTCFMKEVLSKTGTSIASLPLVTGEEIEKIRLWNQTLVTFPENRCVHELFEEQVEQRPDKIAVVHGDTSLTYSVLNDQANRLAQYISSFGIRPDDCVVLCVERSTAMILGLLAILKAGAAYVPIDPAYPFSRLSYILRDAQPTLLLTDAAGRLALHHAHVAVPTIDLDSDSRAWSALPPSNPRTHGLNSHHLAYVIYTSGSTGQPKGVMVEHRNLVHQVVALQRAYSLDATDRLLQFASVAFDMSVEEIFPALLTGATLVLRNDNCLDSLTEFSEFCTKYQLTSLNLPSAFWAQLALEQPEVELSQSVRRVASGGDALSRPAAIAWLSRAGYRPKLFNAYGPTEATVNAALQCIENESDAASIGRPLVNTHVYLLDDGGQLVPIGSIGELCIGGAGVARGYLHRPELTVERFVHDPFSSVPGARMYRTGDLARYLSDGSLEFLGRNDHQVKVRGFRIELGELESVLNRHPAVREAVVLAHGEGSGKRLVAYLVAEAEATDDSLLISDCRTYLAAELPDYMVPAAYIRLDAFPLSANGKLDRKALPDPDAAAFAHRTYEPPRGPVEVALAGLWQELLGIQQIGRHDDFFELGGHSLVAMRLLGRIGQQLGAALPLSSLFRYPTIAGLASGINPRSANEAPPSTLALIVPIHQKDTVPLSYAQQRLWFLAQFEDVGDTYHISLVLHLTGTLDCQALRRSLDRLLERHEALRTVFHSVDGQPRGTVLPASTAFALTEHDLRGQPSADSPVAKHTDEYTHAPFDLEHGPLIRAGLLRRTDEHYTLLLSLHHIVGDGWSMNLLAREVSALYGAFSQGLPDPLPQIPVQYPDYASWQQVALSSDRLQGHREYWAHRLADAPELLNLPTDRPRPPRQSFAGAMVPVCIDPALTRRLKDVCKQHGTTLFMLLTAAWALVLARLSGQDDVLMGTLSANRGQQEVESLIGFFVSTLVLRLDLTGDPDTADLLSRVRKIILAAQENQDLPFEQVVEAARPSRRLDHSPLFQVLFAWQSNERGRFELPGVGVSQAALSFTSIRYDLELHLFEQNHAVAGLMGYSTALFDEATIARHAGYLTTVLEAMVSSPALALTHVPLIGLDEQRLLDHWNDTLAPYSEDACVHRLFERQAKRSPQALALTQQSQQLCYAELNAHANQWARHLRVLGIGANRRVGLCVERGIAMVTALLAILKAGAAYVPLDPSYPSERLLQILDEADLELVLLDAAGQAALGTQAVLKAHLLTVDTLADRCAVLPAANLNSSCDDVTADDLAYVIYTSGSTGVPKGVAMPHRPLVNLVHWQQQQAECAGLPALRTLQFAALGFDVAFQEIFTSLCSGASLFLVDSETRLQFDKLIEQLRRQNIQRMFLPYIALQALAEAVENGVDDELLPELREVIVAGEQLRLTPQIRHFFKRLPACTLHNHYGPTETHVATAQRLSPEEIASGASHVPIGRPIANTRVYLLDRHGLPVPLGAVGELYIGGIGVASGYFGRPDLTADRFLVDPLDTRYGGRMYRTGDLARQLPDGRLVYLGRNDYQVKVRGFRIELGEVEARLAEHSSVRECTVIARETTQGSAQLIAYVVPAANEGGLATALHTHLGHLLPEYMVPSAFVMLSSLPLTAQGKLNRHALPDPDEQSIVHSVYEPPMGGVEAELARLWQDLLGVKRVGRYDRFFDLGGHSLLAIRLLSRVTQTFGVRLPLSALFAQPVLRDVAQAITEQMAGDGESARVAITPTPRARQLSLSHAQQRLWFLAQLDDASGTYHIPFALRLKGTLDRGALHHALNRVFARHESLRTVFIAEQGRPHAELLPVATVLPFREYDLSSSSDVEPALARVLAEERNTPFDLAAGPLMRAVLIHLSKDTHVFMLTLHHIVADGWSLGILARELSAYYAVAHDLQEDPFPPLLIQYDDYVAWERRQLTHERMKQHAEYWRNHLAGATTLLELPIDKLRPARQSFSGAFCPVTLGRDLTQAVKQLAREHNVTVFTVLLAAWASVLSRLSGQQELLIGAPVAARNRQELEGLIGFFVNTVALRISLAAALNMASLLSQVQQVVIDAQVHQEVPFEQVVEMMQVPRRVDRTPLVQIMFAWQSQDEEQLKLPGIEVESVLRQFDWVKFELELILGETDGVIHGGFNYAQSLFHHETIARYAGYLKTVLKQMAYDRSPILGEMRMMSPAEEHLLLEGWNDTETPDPGRLCIHQLVERWAAESPQSVAVNCEQQNLTYAELNAQANCLAHHLIGLGVRPNQRVALCTGKGAPMFIGLLGIMKAGAAYVPLDPAYASDRLGFILQDAAPQLLLCDKASRAALASAGIAWPNMIDIDNDTSWANTHTTNPTIRDLGSRNLAYVIYTSGSTGTPKGVMVEHHGVINLAHSLRDLFGMTRFSRVSQFSSISFDASVLESITAFASGGTVYLPSDVERQSPSAFIAFVERYQITHATLPPAFLQSYTGTPPWQHCPALILAGEAPSPGLIRTWSGYANLFNAYGPTEISVCATVWVCPHDVEDLAVIPIGRPIANTRLYLLNEHRQLVPQGSIGELYIGGSNVARGYLNRPDLTQERFLPDPFSHQANARMYRSGDLARYLPDGNVVFVGRNDHQVKIRGFRIELGEIEANLAIHPAVRESAVLLREDRLGDPRLVAYVATHHTQATLAAELRDHIATRLPEYMVPAAFVIRSSLPLTTHGKLDRKALPPPEEEAFIHRDYEAPRGQVEAALAGMWKDLLGVEQVGRQDHFFELGGHSLMAAQLAAHMSAAYETSVAVRDLFLYPVLQDMAALVSCTSQPSVTTLDLGAEVVLDEAIRASVSARHCAQPQHILLTGASGFLGAFLLSSLLHRTQATIHCLVRCANAADGLCRLDENMRSMGLSDYDRDRVTIIPGDLAEPLLGLSEELFDELGGRIEVIHHNGAWVNSLHSYANLKATNVSGTQEILRLAAAGVPKHIHYISTLSTIPPTESAGSDITTEEQLTGFWPGLSSGYAQSKWVAERLLQVGGQRGIPFTIYRPTHVGASSVSGASNADDTWSLYVDACLTLERVPDSQTAINSLPVDYISRCIVELSLREVMMGKTLNLAGTQPLMLEEVNRQIVNVGGPGMRRVSYQDWRQLCSRHGDTRRLTLIMPSDLPTETDEEPGAVSISLSNAVVELCREGIEPPSLNDAELLRKYVAWRYRRLHDHSAMA